MQGIGSTNFIATNGDIRGDGTLNAAGAINLTAGQIYPTTQVVFTIAADDYTSSGFTLPGLITIHQSGTRQTPLSAGGELDIFASAIRQDGTLRAPIGTINLGAIGTPGLNPISNAPFAITRQLTLDAGSVTSVAADGLTIPYGVNQNGTAWIDPAGVDITVSGVPGKTINIAGTNVADVAGSSIDIRGGGDLFSYRFVSGNGGTRDILASTSSFAIVPGYEADFAPIDPGYANSTLSVGDRIFLNASDALAAGVYTLLPARYALLPGALLVTPKSGVPNGSSAPLADGSSAVSGYRFNDLNPARTNPPINSLFEVAPAAVVKARAEYDIFSANTFLRDAALASNAVPPRLPIDSGQLVLTASQTLAIQGVVTSQAPIGGRGGLVDISSPADILIGRAGMIAPDGALFLDAAGLSSFGAESLLIGGVRSDSSEGTLVTAATGNLTVDNSGSALTGPELILVANQSLTLAPGAEIEQRGAIAGSAETLLLGDAEVAGSGDGLLVRVTSDPTAGDHPRRGGFFHHTNHDHRCRCASCRRERDARFHLCHSTRFDGNAQCYGHGAEQRPDHVAPGECRDSCFHGGTGSFRCDTPKSAGRAAIALALELLVDRYLRHRTSRHDERGRPTDDRQSRASDGRNPWLQQPGRDGRFRGAENSPREPPEPRWRRGLWRRARVAGVQCETRSSWGKIN